MHSVNVDTDRVHSGMEQERRGETGVLGEVTPGSRFNGPWSRNVLEYKQIFTLCAWYTNTHGGVVIYTVSCYTTVSGLTGGPRSASVKRTETSDTGVLSVAVKWLLLCLQNHRVGKSVAECRQPVPWVSVRLGSHMGGRGDSGGCRGVAWYHTKGPVVPVIHTQAARTPEALTSVVLGCGP